MGILERKEREKEQRKNDIIDAAEKVFFEKGYENATMDEVADKAELSKGTLYLYFKTKEELHMAVSVRALKILKKMLMNAVSEKNSTWENILAIGRSYVEFAREFQDYFRTILHFENKECMDHIQQKYAEFAEEADPMSLFIRMLEKGIHDGSVRSDISPSLLAHILWTQTTGVLKLAGMKHMHVDLENTSEDAIINGHLEIISNGIRKNV